ncbi:MAG: hypothetical protein N4J56_007730 [Chroococcidiopsis sp. SAG 2025]|uniref:hypothetical protein n=1 Tax=Chroococcidiopsis sp. SAG 2025 TaxID=171389 RepID=UPI002937105E|nr:hypothetical protein [Chroococcidiopsis sp. SAG 2025]MDV2998025.1 hypothetical protein [Chroococcidiopsis sp. SAG 2025]
MTDASPPDDSNPEQPSDNDSSWERSNQKLQKELEQRIREACQSSTKRQRQKENNKILWLIQESGKLRCNGSFYCEGCLQQVWLYFWENLCEVNREKYPRIKAPFCEEPHIIGRLKLRLNGCIRDAQTENPLPPIIPDFDQIPAPDPEPLPFASLPPFLLETVRAAVEADATGELRRCQLENHSEVNCQMLILQQLSLELEWEALADQLSIPVSSLSPFYDQHCKPLIEKISQQQLLLLVRAKIEADESGELRKCHIKKYPQVTAQVLILRRLPPEARWKDLSNEFNAPSTALSTFYERKCRPRLKAICEPLLNQWQPEEE